MKSLEERRKQIRDCLRRRRERLKKEGICQDCGKATPQAGSTLCFFCLDSRRRNEKLRLHPEDT